MNKRHVGKSYEDLAADYLRMQGLTILEKNYRNRFGEIDLIARDYQQDGAILVFVEVKYRSSNAYGLPVEAVDKKKQRTIVKVAWYYLMQHGVPFNQSVRFDVVTICKQEIRHFTNAFDGFDL